MRKIYTKKCNKCGLTKPTSEFYKRNGRVSYQSYCKECQCILHADWVKKNSERNFLNTYQWKKKNPKRYWGNKTIGHHRDAGHIVQITNDELCDYIKEIDHCEICGKLLCWFNPKTALDSPTLDRIDNGQIITIKNIQLICHQCNTTKNIRTLNEFYDYCELVLKRRDVKESCLEMDL